ncbi:copper/Zinc superoxide dismutase related enzyme [Deinococcus aerius]|uniref:Copper/Zinc superoxide dismutase related enzyme n=1 Tax=Deinococcus aerius TaxID=200253 RepID=A0A2I9D5L1_9DEIO|nr:superoxide dismutase [Deinococcus aerius]GBF05946.1 copper/Zinc superoxide dismutase related enzyme [Deinococcus aerius]
MKKLFAFALPLVLASCTMTLSGSPYTLGKQPAAGDLSPTGTVMGKRYGTVIMTEAQVMGLKPNQYYVAHYHLQGTASPNPCESGGAPIMSSKIVGQTDASGMLMLMGSAPQADVMNATYFNIHTASDAAGTPADAGVACTAVQMPKM